MHQHLLSNVVGMSARLAKNSRDLKLEQVVELVIRVNFLKKDTKLAQQRISEKLYETLHPGNPNLFNSDIPNWDEFLRRRALLYKDVADLVANKLATEYGVSASEIRKRRKQ